MATSPAFYDVPNLLVDWEVLLPSGPALAQHVGCVINNTLYVHGGITKHGSTTPSSTLYRLDLTSMIWNEVRSAGSPALSHHVCIVLQNRYMLLIGGWNGHQRISSLFAFDSQELKWLALRDEGFPDGAGLSSHAACLLDTGEILIVGREGSLKIEKKCSHAFLLKGWVEKGVFTYEEVSENTASRSGHTMNIVNNLAYIVGGRGDEFIEQHKGYNAKESIGKLNTNFKSISKYLQPLSRIPNGRKSHVTMAGKDCFIVHGGETFDGKSRGQAVGDMFLVITKPQLICYKIGTSSVTRSAHVCVSTGDRIIFHGGKAWKNVIYGDCYELKLRIN